MGERQLNFIPAPANLPKIECDLGEVPCTGCDHKCKYHHLLDLYTFECAQCGGRCTYDGKTTFPTIHDIAN